MEMVNFQNKNLLLDYNQVSPIANNWKAKIFIYNKILLIKHFRIKIIISVIKE